MEYKSDVNVPLLITLGIAGGVLLIVVVIGVQAWNAYVERTAYGQEAKTAQVTSLVELRDQQVKSISERTVEGNRITAIPIDEAIRDYVARGGKMPLTRPATRSTRLSDGSTE